MVNLNIWRAIAAALLLAGSAACSEQPNQPAQPEQPQEVVGGDRDAHGCIASAGYLWCGRTETCERPWELAEREGIDNTAEAFSAFCGSESPEV